MAMSRFLTPVSVLLCAGAAMPCAAQSWNSSSPGLWNDPANWSPMVVPNSVGAVVDITSTVQGGVLASGGAFTFNAPVTLGSLDVNMGTAGPSVFINNIEFIFDNGGGADVFIDGDGSLAANITGPITLMGDLRSTWRASNATFSGSISGDYGIVHEPLFGLDRLKLWGVNTYTGETVCTEGQLSIIAASGLGSHDVGTTIIGPGDLVVETNPPAVISGEVVTLQDNGRMLMRKVDWAETIVLDGAGEIAPWFDNIFTEVSGQLTGDTFIRYSAQSRSGDPLLESLLTVSNTSNDYTGGTIIRGGILAIPSDDVLGGAGTGITFEEVGFTEGPPVLLTTSDVTIPRDISLLDDGWLRAVRATTATYTGEISGSRALSVGGVAGPGAVMNGFVDWDGTIVLQSDNSYTGGTNVVLGSLVVDNILGSGTGSGTVVVGELASLGGGGIVGGSVDMTAGGVLDPGGTIGSIIIGGTLTQGPLTTTLIEINSPNPGQFDKAICGAPTTLDGELIVVLGAGYTQQAGHEFEILTAPSVSGSFSTETLPEGFEVQYEANRVRLVVMGLPVDCPADFNGDNVVNASDLAVILAAWGQSGVADLDNSGTVDPGDLAIVLAAWGPCPE